MLATLPSGLRLAYETHGRGETLLLIAGLGRDRRMWDAQVPALSKGLRVVTFDNRGVGQSDSPAGPYTAAQMAADAAGLLDVLEVESAHVAGASLGGLIAQELALSRPARVSRLALLCTHPGQPLCVPMAQDVL
ncbi:alpha/beta fold hydrolase, partial [bacterium]